MPEQCKELKLQDVWRTCNKIRAAIFRVGFNLWDYFKPLDPSDCSLISESKFISVFLGPLKGPVGLSEKEVCDLADYFRVQDGRILYKQFCQIIHDNVPEFDKNKPLVTGLEWEDPLHVNRLSATEHRKLNLILVQIAVLVNKRKLVLRPYFQDYELIAKNGGTVTVAHFGRILKFLGIVLGSEEFRLLVKRFVKDAYTINYVAFLRSLEDVQNDLDRHGMLTIDGKLLEQFPGRVITAELPKLPRPEIGNVEPSRVFGEQSVFHPVMERARPAMSLLEVVRRVQRHVFERRIRLNEFFKDFDALNVGKVTVAQFRRGLDALQVSSLGRLYLSQLEIEELVDAYRDPNDPQRVCWKTFEDDIDQVFTIKELEKYPNIRVESPPKEVAELPRIGESDWQREPRSMRDLCEEVLQKVRARVQQRGIYLKQFFNDYDRLNSGHVSRAQLRQVLKTSAVLLSPEEEFALERRYKDDLGFNYYRFLDELEAAPIVPPLYDRLLETKRQINAEKPARAPRDDETDIVLILAKIKAKLVRERIKAIEFLRPFDPRNELVIKRADFQRGIDQLRCALTPTEVETVMDVFKAPLRPDFVEYARFGRAVEEAAGRGSLERAALLVPVQHVPSEACARSFLNFDERRALEGALDKLCRVPEPNLDDLFKDYDKENIGTLSKNALMRALATRRMLNLISSRELDVIHKCFGIERGGRLEIDYRAFLRVLHLLRENRKYLPF